MQPKTKQLTAYFILVATIVALLLCLKTSHLKQEQSEYTFKAYEEQLAALDSKLLKQYATIDSLLNKDDSIVIKYRTIIKNVPVITLPQYQKIYSDIVGSEVYTNDSLVCLDKTQLDSLTITLYKGFEGLERLEICQMLNNELGKVIDIKDGIIHFKDSTILSCSNALKVCSNDTDVLKEKVSQQRLITRIWQGVAAVVGLIAVVK
jgi:hypothetical protein